MLEIERTFGNDRLLLALTGMRVSEFRTLGRHLVLPKRQIRSVEEFNVFKKENFRRNVIPERRDVIRERIVL